MPSADTPVESMNGITRPTPRRVNTPYSSRPRNSACATERKPVTYWRFSGVVATRASRPSASSTRVRRALMCGSMAFSSGRRDSAEIGQDLPPEELDGVVHLGHPTRDEQHAGERGDAHPLVGPDPLRDLGRAADQVARVEAPGLLSESRPLERLQVLEELRG